MAASKGAIVGAVGAADTALARAAARSDLNAFIRLTPERAAADARAARADLPLAGWTVAVKDLIDVAGFPTTAGGQRSTVPRRDAAIVGRLRRAGAVVVGKSNMDEWGVTATGRNRLYGDARNPHAPGRLAGGSSSGSSAAVAARITRAGLGTDTAGSLRIPASFCGVTALKPTADSIDVRGVIGLAPTLDVAGPIARTAMECARLVDVMRGLNPGTPPALRGRRLGIVDGEPWQAVESEVGVALEAAGRSMERLGLRLVDVEVAQAREATEQAAIVLLYELVHHHATRWRRERGSVGPQVEGQLAGGAAISLAEYRAALAARSKWRIRLAQLFGRVDLLLHATTSGTAPPVEAAVRTSDLTRLCSPWNLAGAPVLAVPCGVSSEGLPIGGSIVGAPDSSLTGERLALALGEVYQQRSDWHHMSAEAAQ